MDTERLLIAILRAHMCHTPVQLLEQTDWEALLNLTADHGLVPIVCHVLREVPQTPSEILKKMDGAYCRAIFRDTQWDYTREQIARGLTVREVPHIFLRGVCLKHDYPVPALRTMSDMDILVKTQDYGKIQEFMDTLGAVPQDGDGNHRTYYIPAGGVTVEFHPNLIHCACPVGTGVNPGWQYAAAQTAGEMELTEEGAYLNVLCHLANHFVAGGVGVRFVLDVWVCRHLRKAPCDRSFVEQQLEALELLEFARNIETLAEHWFSGAPGNEVTEALAEYILTSGSHGTSERAMLNAVCLSPGGSSGSALVKKIFYPRQELENRFPWCQNKPWLLPAAWCVRAWKAVTRKGDLIAQWGKGTGSFTAEQVEEHTRLLARFGIQRPGCR